MTNDSTQTSGEATSPTLFKMAKPKREDIWSMLSFVAPTVEQGKKFSTSDCKEFYCHVCEKKFDYVPGQSHHARQHVETNHSDMLEKYWKDMDARKQQGVKRYFPTRSTSSAKKMKCGTADQERIETLMVNWFAKSLRPFALVEDPGFREFVRQLQAVKGEFRVPSRTTIKRKTASNARKERNHLRNELRNAVDTYCLTTDIWTCRNVRSFLALTIHYVTEDFDLKEHSLEVCHFPGKHTSGAICDKLASALGNWGLDLK